MLLTAPAIAGGVLSIAAVAAFALPAVADDPQPTPPGMARMHERMMDGNPGMARMHERMMDGNPGMARMHERMMDGNPGMARMHAQMTPTAATAAR